MTVVAAVAWNLGVPTLLVLWLGLARTRRRAVVVLDVVTALLWSLATLLAGLWLASPTWLILLPLLGVPVAFRARVGRDAVDPGPGCGPNHHHGQRRRRVQRVAAAGLRGVALILGLGFVSSALLGRAPPPGGLVDLASPLPAGTWLVANGGSTGAVNPHLRTREGSAAAEWRGQSHAVDLVAAGAWGSRTRATLAPDLEDYGIFGAEVVAPCAGRVVVAHDGEPERHESSAPWRTRPGNHVLLDCGEAWVLLAHFTTGSVVVAVGDDLGVGDPIARVGNSGASGEPHLHVHAQAPGTVAAPFGATPYPITIDGRFLVRNDRLRSPRPRPGA